MSRDLWPLLVVLCSVSFGQQYPIRTYTVADGLAEDRVNAILADSRGYIWIGANGGLSRFDGYGMKTYGAADGLPSRFVEALLETPDGAYLVGTSRGLCRLENRGEKAFAQISLEGLNPFISGLLLEPSGRILGATLSGLFAGASGQPFHKLVLDALLGERVIALANDHAGNLWISTEVGLGILDSRGGWQIFQPGRGLPAAIGHAAMMREQPAGRMWLATNVGLALMTQPAGREWRLDRLLNSGGGLAGNDMDAIAADSEGRLWLGTTGGISRFDPGAPLPPRFDNLGVQQGLSAPLVSALACDPAGNMWAGTENAGVMRVARHGFLTYRHDRGLPEDRIAQLLEDRSGQVLALSISAEEPFRRLHVFDGRAFQSFVPGILSSDGAWGRDHVFLQARSGEWWVAGRHALYRFPSGKAESLATAHPIAYPAENVYHLFEDSSGNIWATEFLRHGRSLMRWNAGTQTVSWFCSDGSISSEPCLTPELVSAMEEDTAHNIWIGVWDSGLLRYSGGRLTVYRAAEGIPPGVIRALHIDRRGRLWVGAAGGLGLVADPTAANPHFEVYTQARGLSSSVVVCIAEDGAGRLYFGTSRGVDSIDSDTLRIRHLTPLEGVPYGGFTTAIRDHAGNIWFGGNGGVSRFTPEPVVAATASPRVLISNLQAGGRDYNISQLGEERVGGIELSSSRNQVQVEFIAPGAASAADLRYQFKLTGADDRWTEPRAQHAVDYRNLAAGSYRFLVKAVDREGHESAIPAEVDFSVLPPLWQRWWFELGALCAVCAVLYSLHAYRLSHLVAMERMRTAIATDLHDDIGSSLAQIAVLSDVAHASGGSPANVGDLARELIDSVNDIVWAMRAGDQSIESLTRRMREFAAEFLDPAGISFFWNSAPPPPDLRLSLQTRRQLFLVYKECLHNIVKHSACRNAWISLEFGPSEAAMTVSDDGKGLNGSAARTREGNGLVNMRRRAESLGGIVEIAGRPGGGCQVMLRLPVRSRVFRGPEL